MLVLVKKPFPYAHDCRTHVELQVGDVVDIDPGVIEGLHAEGFIDEASDTDIAGLGHEPVLAPAAIEIPPDWRGLHWFKLKVLAEKVSGGPVASKAVAVAVLEAATANLA